LISVVTVSLNPGLAIQRTLKSVLDQKLKHHEYLVIDGGSTDGTIDILKKHESQLDQMISEPDRGISDAFNKGIRLAKGEVIGILNAGDWYEPDALKIVAEAFSANPHLDIVCGAVEFWEEGSPQLHCYSNPELLDKETSVYHPTVFVKKFAYLKYGVFDESYRYAMDYELLLRFKRKGAKFLSIENTLANMSLDGVSYRHWYSALKEARTVRSQYFPWYNVAYYHSIAVLKNIVARLLKRTGLRSTYQAYWQSRNRKIATTLRRDR
jgi:glycosyltransferase involved in cell wall biosynthesis